MNDESVIRRGRHNGYTVIQNSALRDQRLGLKTKGLFAIMVSLPDDWEYSIDGIASFVGVSRYAIREAMSELEKAGYLIREQSHDEDGKFSAAVYVFQEDAPPCVENRTTVVCENAPSFEKPHAVKPSSENRTTVTILNRQNKDLTKTPIAPKGGECTKVHDFEPELFERFWDFYPNWGGSGKGNKQRAKKAWNKLKPDASLRHTIAAALKKQMATKAWQDGVGIPHASTYLNGHRWEDAEELQTERPRAAGEYESVPVYGHQIGGTE